MSSTPIGLQDRSDARSTRKIIFYGATSADGYTARPDGDVKWLDRPRPAGNYGMGEFYKSIDTVVMGRKTFGGKAHYPGKKNYVFSRTMPRSVLDVEFVRGDVSAFARQLRATEGKDIWLVGGAGLAAAFLDAGQLDEFIIHVAPILIGEGIPLIQPRHRLVRLELLSSQQYEDGAVRLHYRVPRNETTKEPKNGERLK